MSDYILKGIGAKRWEAFNKAGFFTPVDLLTLFPYMYFDRTAKPDLDRIPYGEKAVFRATFISRPVPVTVRRGLTLIKAKLSCEEKVINAVWFNMTYVVSVYKAGDTRVFYGKLLKKSSSFELINPQILSERDMDIMPVYKLPKGIGQALFTENIKSILSQLRFESYISPEMAYKHNIMPLMDAFNSVHFPIRINEAKNACRSISLEKLSYTLGIYKASRPAYGIKRTFKYEDNRNKLNDIISKLPYTLTKSQENAVNEIVSGLLGGEYLNILLEGDVGSGKTIVSFLAMIFAAMSGYQAAIMAPTEILAAQHYENAIRFFTVYGFNVGLLTGSMKKNERTELLRRIREGEVQIVVGTHAVIGEDVEFKNLSFTIVDEQHRFGVCQRAALENKAQAVDKIVMSATPIPRTLALSLYGELKTVKLIEKPFNSKNISTLLVHSSRLDDMYDYIIKKAGEGEKTYIVCPRIDSEDDLSAVGLFNELRKTKFRNTKIGLVHGKMKEKEKNSVINDFRTGNIMILVSTTVIEVGVDIPSANNMAIFGAEKFGLSQLHQLRGRIGRSGDKAYCFLISDSTNERLDVLKNETDGFKLAEADFNMRGAGDFLGTRQHGEIENYLGVKIDAEMIKEAVDISNDLLKNPDFLIHASENNDKIEFVKGISLN